MNGGRGGITEIPEHVHARRVGTENVLKPGCGRGGLASLRGGHAARVVSGAFVRP